MNLSLNTLMIAIKTTQREEERLKARLKAEKLSEEDFDYYQQNLLDLIDAGKELQSFYELRQMQEPSLNPIDQLLSGHDPFLT